jgi:hypothetical protein
MNIFKAIGVVVNSAVAVVVRALKSIENVMEVVEITTDNLVDETKLENAETSAINKARLAALEKRLAKEAAELDKE